MGFLFRFATAMTFAACWSSPDAMIAFLRHEVVEPVRANCAPDSLLCAEQPLRELASALTSDRQAVAPEPQDVSAAADMAANVARVIAVSLGRH